MNESDCLLSIANLSKSFGGLQAINNLDMEVPKGTIMALIGPNGAGKTTVFNCITGFARPDSGRIIFRNGGSVQDLSALPPHKISRLGLSRTFQNMRLFADLPAIDHVKLGYFAKEKKIFRVGKTELNAEKIGWDLLEFVGLREIWREKPGSLPYGFQRRLELARALATEPKLILLDEPAAGLNPHETEELMATIVKIRDKGITVFLIEHDMSVVMSISDSIVVLDYGVKIAQGTPTEITEDRKVIDVYLGAC